METQNRRNPGGCVAALWTALGQDALEEFQRDGEPSPTARRAAYAVAVAQGYCRLFQVEPGDVRSTLPVRMAVAACAVLGEQLVGWTEDAVQLAERWDAAHGQSERDGLCVGLLEARLDAWAAFVAVDEAGGAVVARAEPAGHFPEAAPVDPAGRFGSEDTLKRGLQLGLEAALDDLARRLAAFDDALSEQEDILSTICTMPLLDDWRTMLRNSPFVEHGFPWWLDGSLEATAAWIDADGARRPWMMPRTREADPVEPARFGKSWILRQIEPLPAVALGSEKRPEARTGSVAVVWRSPDNKFLAQLTFPRSADLRSGWELRLTLVWADPRGQPAVGRFQTVRLSGMRELPVAPAESGVVLDSREFFDQADERPRLSVDDQEWPLLEVIGGDS